MKVNELIKELNKLVDEDNTVGELIVFMKIIGYVIEEVKKVELVESISVPSFKMVIIK